MSGKYQQDNVNVTRTNAPPQVNGQEVVWMDELPDHLSPKGRGKYDWIHSLVDHSRVSGKYFSIITDNTTELDRTRAAIGTYFRHPGNATKFSGFKYQTTTDKLQNGKYRLFVRVIPK